MGSLPPEVGPISRAGVEIRSSGGGRPLFGCLSPDAGGLKPPEPNVDDDHDESGMPGISGVLVAALAA